MSQKKVFGIISVVIITLVVLFCFWKISTKPKFTTVVVQKPQSHKKFLPAAKFVRLRL